MGHFKVKKITNLKTLKEGSKESFPESDYAITTNEGKFIQFEYLSEDSGRPPIEVGPHVYMMTPTQFGIQLFKTEFTQDALLGELTTTKEIEAKINSFFNRLHIYEKKGVFPKRAALFYGPAGTGKSSQIRKVVENFMTDGETATIIWPTDSIEPRDVAEAFKRFEYKVKKLIFVVEDIGGTEIQGVNMRSDSGLLALLDNQEKAFKIPTQILATTNHPENFLGNLMNRPNRFDDKFSIGYPKSDARLKLLQFFGGELVDKDSESMIQSKTCEEFTPAHIREATIRAELYDMTLVQAITQIKREIDIYNKAFSEKTGSMGFGSFND